VPVDQRLTAVAAPMTLSFCLRMAPPPMKPMSATFRPVHVVVGQGDEYNSSLPAPKRQATPAYFQIAQGFAGKPFAFHHPLLDR
jgi:hypothetical protein